MYAKRMLLRPRRLFSMHSMARCKEYSVLSVSEPGRKCLVQPWASIEGLDASQCHDPHVQESDLQLLEGVVTPEEEQFIAEECTRIMKKRRLQKDHWDQVIVKYKETERMPHQWSDETRKILERVRDATIFPTEYEYKDSYHVIDLAADGYIMPHVDAVKFSGQVVAGLSLLSPSIMRFREEDADNQIDLHLSRRSLYMMTGRVRYNYTHEILPGDQVFKQDTPVHRTRRISIMMRAINPNLPAYEQ